VEHTEEQAERDEARAQGRDRHDHEHPDPQQPELHEVRAHDQGGGEDELGNEVDPTP